MNRRLLLVEDHDSLRNLMGIFLSKNFEVTSAKNGIEALASLRKGSLPDVIVTDANMPDLNGAELLANLQCSGMYADIPVVVLSGADNNEQSEQQFKSLGASDYIKKPFNPVTLKDRLLQLVK